jgi:hypothetical protein
MNFAAAGLVASLLAAIALPPGVIEASDQDPVRITSVSLSAQTLHSGDVVTAHVVTTSNAAAVTAQVGTFRVLIPKTKPGIFESAMVVPSVPFIFRTTHQIVFTAIRTDGASVSRSLSIKLR